MTTLRGRIQPSEDTLCYNADMTVLESIYCDQLDIAESLWAFHPDAFDNLGTRVREAIIEYYGLGADAQDVLFYMREVATKNPNLWSFKTWKRDLIYLALNKLDLLTSGFGWLFSYLIYLWLETVL